MTLKGSHGCRWSCLEGNDDRQEIVLPDPLGPFHWKRGQLVARRGRRHSPAAPFTAQEARSVDSLPTRLSMVAGESADLAALPRDSGDVSTITIRTGIPSRFSLPLHSQCGPQRMDGFFVDMVSASRVVSTASVAALLYQSPVLLRAVCRRDKRCLRDQLCFAALFWLVKRLDVRAWRLLWAALLGSVVPAASALIGATNLLVFHFSRDAVFCRRY